MKAQLEVPASDLAYLERVWDGGLATTYERWRSRAEPRLALAAAMVETAVGLQRLGYAAAPPPDLLLADLCLARASRLLAGIGRRDLQVGFARAVESVAAEAAGGQVPPDISDLLEAQIRQAP